MEKGRSNSALFRFGFGTRTSRPLLSVCHDSPCRSASVRGRLVRNKKESGRDARAPGLLVELNRVWRPNLIGIAYRIFSGVVTGDISQKTLEGNFGGDSSSGLVWIGF